ncbi:MAG: carbon-nitrogen hydrolase family protein [Lactimicrobium sp.]|uniref:carbon-nitrogen hydrolase family protein n=1 Tax=Lactimicrobium sp. TaxID=2563780 RepID=UPI002F35AD59
MKLAMAQISMRNNMNENYKKTQEYIEKAVGSDVLFFPQLQLTPYFPQLSGLDASRALSRMSDARLKGMAYQAQKNHMYISPNVYLEQDGRMYDASLWFDKEGVTGETAKMVHVMNTAGSYDKDYFQPGAGFVVHETPAGKIGIVIGADRHFPESMRCCALLGARLVLVPAAISKEEDPAMTAAEMRVAAMENGFFVAVCNRTGKEGRKDFAGRSMVIDPSGNVLKEADDTEQLMQVDLDLSIVEDVRKGKPYLSNRRPDVYGLLTKQVEG